MSTWCCVNVGRACHHHGAVGLSRHPVLRILVSGATTGVRHKPPSCSSHSQGASPAESSTDKLVELTLTTCCGLVCALTQAHLATLTCPWPSILQSAQVKNCRRPSAKKSSRRYRMMGHQPTGEVHAHPEVTPFERRSANDWRIKVDDLRLDEP